MGQSAGGSLGRLAARQPGLFMRGSGTLQTHMASRGLSPTANLTVSDCVTHQGRRYKTLHRSLRHHE